MTRINTNVSSMNAQKSLARSNASLQEALTRLSTGLRINSGKDDPAGLIASEALRADITATESGIKNSERANQMIATADSALGQVSNLLNDIRGLVTEAANSGAMSEDQISANQLQIDSSLAAINRIAQTTSFQGRKLLDGSLGFQVEGSTNFVKVQNLQINQANMGTADSLTVNAQVTTSATQAQVDIANIPTATTPANASTTFSISNAVAQGDSGAMAFTATGATSTLQIQAAAGQGFAGADGNLSISFELDGTITADAAVVVANGAMTIKIKDAATTLSDIETAVETLNADSSGFATGDFTATVANDAAIDPADYSITGQMTGGRDAGAAVFKVTSDQSGVNTKTVTVDGTGTAANDAQASIDGSGNIVVHLNGTVSNARIAEVINSLDGYSAEVSSQSGDTNTIVGTDTLPAAPSTMANGRAASGGLAQAVTFSVAGKGGSEVFSFSQGASIAQMQAAINALSDSTGVAASASGTTLQLKSNDYGSAAFVDVKVISEPAGGIVTTSVGQGTRDEGTDIVGQINGIEATGVGSTLKVANSRLDISMQIATSFTGSVSFNINGGGALFQLGPDVISNQQSRVGIDSMATSSLGSSAGKLYELQSGGSKSLTGDIVGAGTVLDAVISQVTTIRGRLGAFQKTTLETNISTLNDTMEALTEAESSIRDADFAQESAQLTRAQILVQSGVAVLSQANQNPQNVLQLLR